MMIEIVVPPPIDIGITLGILDGHIGAIERSRGKTPTPTASRTIGVLSRQRELQLPE
jgi:hypothetical protein